MTRTGWQPRIAIREGADGYVYIYLARQDTMEGAEEVCRVRREFTDPELMQSMGVIYGEWMMRCIAALTGTPRAQLGGCVTAEPPEQRS